METGTEKAVGSRTKAGTIVSWLAIGLMNFWVPILMILETAIGIAIFPLLLAIWLLATDWPVGKILRHFVWIYGRVWLWIVSPFVSFESIGFDPARFARPSVIVVNHLSFFDMYYMAALPVFDVIIFLRSWPFKMAWYAPFMRLAEYVDVERLPWEQVVERTRQYISDGRFVLLFPQGHRSRDGRLGHFYSGAFRLARQFGVPVVPICLSGTDRLLPPGRRWLAPSRVRMECLEPIDASAFPGELGHINLRKQVKRLMGAHLADHPH